MPWDQDVVEQPSLAFLRAISNCIKNLLNSIVLDKEILLIKGGMQPVPHVYLSHHPCSRCIKPLTETSIVAG